jgi:1,4-alpha-glucan branching enzyme
MAARLSGSWNVLVAGRARQQRYRWNSSSLTMAALPFVHHRFDDSQIGESFDWGVAVSTAEHADSWGIISEVNSDTTTERFRSFVLCPGGQTETYYLTTCRRLGANKLIRAGQPDAIRFACWAPNAQNVELAIGTDSTGYIWNDGRGVVEQYPMYRSADGVWETSVDDAPALAAYKEFDHTPYMYRITREGGSVRFRSDLYSRCQIGSGGKNPEAPRPGEVPWDGTRTDLDGSKSCSVVIDPERVCDLLDEDVGPETRWLSEEDFWRDEYRPDRPVPERLDDLVIYELHVDSLGLGRAFPAGTLQDAMNLIPYLCDLGVNAIELMPLSEFQDRAGWGYSTSHYFAIEYSGGGRDKFKHFVRECHRNGIAVLLDVVYNHYTFDAERAEYAYDSPRPENDIYYWYEGTIHDYTRSDGGYVDNGSSGWAPRWWEDPVRRLFTSSATALLSEFHFDGFRVDLTQAIHRDNVRHADGRPVPSANVFGQKFLREWSNILRLIHPNVFLIAEDHTGWRAVFQPTDQGGLGFDATWYADYYHHLIGDAQNDPSRARLIRLAGYGDNDPLRLGWFANTLAASADSHVIYHESHDEAGNAENSGRTIVVAVNGAPLIGDTRRYAEARVHFAAGMTLTAPGIPMFFMGEEVGAALPYRYDDVQAGRETREDLTGLRAGYGAHLFRFYSDLIRLRLEHPALRSRSCDLIHMNDDNRICAFRRRDLGEDLIVIGSLNNQAFGDGYNFWDSRITDGQWHEILNSDAVYGDQTYGTQARSSQMAVSSRSRYRAIPYSFCGESRAGPPPPEPGTNFTQTHPYPHISNTFHPAVPVATLSRTGRDIFLATAGNHC